MENNNLFLGIDLGTTNSVLAYAHFRNNKLQANVVKIARSSERGGNIAADTLPSVVFYQKNKKGGSLLPIVGDFAKAQYGKKYGYVVKSVKSQMGKDGIPGISPELPDQRPEEVSAQILKHLLRNGQTKLTLKDYPRDVVITIPASFDADMREATFKAANLAGLEVYNKDGSYKDILLYEPKAVLYNFINDMINGEIPEHIVDFSTPKNILVYDLGGGTLDVSIHRVSRDAASDILEVQDLGISMHHLLAGDDFDNMIAEKLMQRFLADNREIGSLNNQERTELLSVLTQKAEVAKISMSEKYEMYYNMNNEIMPDDEEEYISEIHLYKGYSFENYMRKDEMEEWIEPLLAGNLKLDDYKRVNAMQGSEIRNIIYPVLDAMAKALEKLPGMKIDHVILNGGMSKFYPVRQRLEKLFGMQPIVITDPDKSVAKGAVIYHYYMHKYNMTEHVSFDGQAGICPNKAEAGRANELFQSKPAVVREKAAPARPYMMENVGPAINLGREIQNNTLNIGLRNGYVEPIVKAGTELPFISKTIEKFALQQTGRVIEIPFYVGSASTTNLPNRKIASRRIQFAKDYPANTSISIKLGVSRLGMLELQAWPTANPVDCGTISLNSQAVDKAGDKGIKAAKITCTQSGRILNVKAELHSLQQYCDAYQSTRSNGKKQSLSAQIKKSVADICQCGNPSEFGTAINAMLKTAHNHYFMQRLLKIGKAQYESWDRASRRSFYDYCSCQVRKIVLMNGLISGEKSDIIEAVNAFTMFDEQNDKDLLGKVISLHDKAFSGPASVVYAKRHFAGAVLADYLMYYPSNTPFLDSAIWSIGKSYSREINNYNDKAKMEIVLKHLLEIFNKNNNEHLRGLALYAIGEIGDQRSIAVDPIAEAVVRPIIKRLQNAYDSSLYYGNYRERLLMVIKMLTGQGLSGAEDAQLLKLRDSFSDK